MLSRRKLLSRGAVFAGGAALLDRLSSFVTGSAPSTRATHLTGRSHTAPRHRRPLVTRRAHRPGSAPYTPVVTPNGTTLPFVMKNGVKEFHLIAEPVKREFAPGMVVNCWGYNGQTPGPTIEAVEGDRVRILVTNRLPEHTSVHWHGVLLPSGHGRRRRAHPAAHQAGRDLRLRVHAEAARHPHVPPPRRRDGADGARDDGLLRHPPAPPRPGASTGGPRLLRVPPRCGSSSRAPRRRTRT